MSMSGGELITGVLRAHGVGTVFSVAGASHTHLLDPLDRAGVSIISNRHEAGAVGGADGYARATGGIGVAMIVADQGLPNAIGALAVAWHAQSPVLLLVAAPPRIFVEAETGIDQDKLALVTPVSAWARTVPDAERLADYLETAIKNARMPRQGPVVLLIPENILQAEISQVPETPFMLPAAGTPDENAINAAADLLSQAQRPLIIAGSGAAWAGAGDSLAEISKTWGIPVFMNALGRGQVAEDGVLSFSWPYAQMAARQADVVLIIGARMTQRLGLGLPPRFSNSARFIQIDNDPRAFHRNRPTDVPVLGDAAACVSDINSALGNRISARKFDSSWVTKALESRATRISEILSGGHGAIHPLQLAAAINERLPASSIFVADGADIATWMYGAIRIQRRRGFMDHYPMGAMGSCTALAVGAAAAEKEAHGEQAAPVVLVTGDGAIGFHPGEIHAAVLAGLNLMVIVGNDGAWGTELHGQQEAIGRDINTKLGQLPYEKLAEAFGASGISIKSLDQLEHGLEKAFEAKGTVLVNVLIDPDAGKELKTNPDIRMILFSDILSGQASLSRLTGAMEERKEGT